MAEIIQFTSKAESDAAQNLTEFIRVCKDELTAFGADLPFAENVWDISAHNEVKGRQKATRVVFSNLAASWKSEPAPVMSEAFLPFAKAYFRYMHALRPTTAFANRLAALRVLDASLGAMGFDGAVTATTHDIMDHACNVVVEHYSESLAPKIAGALESIFDFLVEKQFVQARTKWVKPIRKARDMGGRVGKAADLAREQKLPSVAAIEAMAHVFTHATEPVELYVGSALALLHCAPQRINETVRLSALCEAEALDTEGNVQYGLRWPGSKGFENSVKWIVPTMSPVARRAVSNLKAASAEARTIAAWYEQNPTAVYLPDRLAYLRKQDRLSLAELSSALYGSDDKIQSAMAWCTREKVPRKGGTCKFSDVEAAVIAMLPPEFPYAQPNLKFSDALFAVRKFELDAQLFTYACLVDYLSSDQISSRLTSRSSVAESVFERFHLTEDDGKPIKLKTHQVRHYLNTLAQANGVSQLDIAMWSGRADVAQNKAYDHVTADQLLSKAVDLAVSSNSALFGGDLDTPKPRVLATRDAVGNLQNSTAHITDYGMCTHDYAASPCHIHLDCLNCNELVCVKGDRVKTGNIRRLKDETEELLRQAEIAERSETYGASRWVEHQRKTLEHCTQLINILDNPAVKTGALVKLAGIQPASRIAQAAAERSGATTIALPQRINKLLERVKRG